MCSSCARETPAIARPGQGRLAERTLARAHPELLPLLRSCSERYNHDAAELERRAQRSPSLPLVRQIAVPPGGRLVPRFSIDRDRIVDSVRLGAYTGWPPPSTARPRRCSGSRFPDLLPDKTALTPRLAA